MVDERESPSEGWQTVYREMAADPNAEEATRSCPDCGHTCENVLRDVYECEEHGVFRASATDGKEAVADAGEPLADDAEEPLADDVQETDDDAPDETDEVENRAREPAD